MTTNSRYETEFDYLGTLEATAGVAFGRIKIGVSGGLAVAEVENAIVINIPNNRPPIFPYTPMPFTESDRLFGYTVGAGIAYQVTDKLTLNLDVAHFDLEDQTVRAIDPPVFGPQFSRLRVRERRPVRPSRVGLPLLRSAQRDGGRLASSKRRACAAEFFSEG